MKHLVKRYFIRPLLFSLIIFVPISLLSLFASETERCALMFIFLLLYCYGTAIFKHETVNKFLNVLPVKRYEILLCEFLSAISLSAVVYAILLFKTEFATVLVYFSASLLALSFFSLFYALCIRRFKRFKPLAWLAAYGLFQLGFTIGGAFALVTGYVINNFFGIVGVLTACLISAVISVLLHLQSLKTMQRRGFYE